MIQDNSELRAMFTSLLSAIDNKNWRALAGMLHADTHYEVSGFPLFSGRDEVLDYYQNIRPIKNGEHKVDTIVVEGNSGVCCGWFIGEKNNGELIDILFADSIVFENLKIRHRRVYFCQPV